jgi:uncharacterized protein DUF5615
MRAKLDENVPIEAAELLRAAGWNCETVYDEGLAGADDPEVGAACQAEARVLFTLDLDFADIRAYPPNDMSASWCFDRVNPADGRCLTWWPGFFRSWPSNGSSINSGSWSRRVFAYGVLPNQLFNSACTRRR